MYADGMENSMKKYSVYKSLWEYYSTCCFGEIFQKGIISKKKSLKSSHPISPGFFYISPTFLDC